MGRQEVKTASATGATAERPDLVGGLGAWAVVPRRLLLPAARAIRRRRGAVWFFGVKSCKD